MSFIKLNDPVRVESIYQHKQYFETSERLELPTPVDNEIGLVDILAKRRTRYEFDTLSLAEISFILWNSVKAKDIQQHTHQSPTIYKCVPSAGAKHVNSVLVFKDSGSGLNPYLYNDIDHSLEKIINIDDKKLKIFITGVTDIFPIKNGTLFWTIALTEKLSCRYQHFESLMLRDAGAIHNTWHLLAESRDLNTALMGQLSCDIFSDSVDSQSVMGTGGCVIGSR